MGRPWGPDQKGAEAKTDLISPSTAPFLGSLKHLVTCLEASDSVTHVSHVLCATPGVLRHLLTNDESVLCGAWPHSLCPSSSHFQSSGPVTTNLAAEPTVYF